MWDWGPDADLALLGGHTAVARVDVLHSGRPVYQLAVAGGSVGMDATRPVLGNLTASLFDPSGNLTRGDAEDLLDAYECEIMPWRGVRLTELQVAQTTTPNAGFGVQGFGVTGFGGVEATASFTRLDVDELAPLGIFALTNKAVSENSEGLTISLTGQDRSINYQTPMDSPLAIPGGTPVEDAIIRLLSRVHPRLSMVAMQTGHTCGPLIYSPDAEVWREAQVLAASVGGRIYHDRTGQCVFSTMGPSSSTPVAAYAEGGGLLVTATRTEDTDTIRNVVVAESPNGMIRAMVEDTDSTSPTYVRGKYPRKVRTISNQHYGSVAQATQAAAARLAYELGRSETAALTAVPNAGLDVDDLILVHRPVAGLEARILTIATLDMPLGADQLMSVGCRRTVLGRDGQVHQVIEDMDLAAA